MKRKATCLNCGWRHEDRDFRDLLVITRNHLIHHGKDGCEIVVVNDKHDDYISVKLESDGYLRIKWTGL